MPNKFVTILIVIIMLLGLANELTLAEDIVFEIVPNKSFGAIKLGDNLENTKDNIETIAQRANKKCFSENGIFLPDTKYGCMGSNYILNLQYDENKVWKIKWLGLGKLVYVNKDLVPYKTLLTDIKKIFPGGKTSEFISEKMELEYAIPQKGLEFYFECNGDFIQKEQKYKYSQDNCYLTELQMYKVEK